MGQPADVQSQQTHQELGDCLELLYRMILLLQPQHLHLTLNTPFPICELKSPSTPVSLLQATHIPTLLAGLVRKTAILSSCQLTCKLQNLQQPCQRVPQTPHIPTNTVSSITGLRTQDHISRLSICQLTCKLQRLHLAF
jgi:hypothetical protein